MIWKLITIVFAGYFNLNLTQILWQIFLEILYPKKWNCPANFIFWKKLEICLWCLVISIFGYKWHLNNKFDSTWFTCIKNKEYNQNRSRASTPIYLKIPILLINTISKYLWQLLFYRYMVHAKFETKFKTFPG